MYYDKTFITDDLIDRTAEGIADEILRSGATDETFIRTEIAIAAEGAAWSIEGIGEGKVARTIQSKALEMVNASLYPTYNERGEYIGANV